VIDTIINQAKINRVGLASGDPKFRPVYSIYVAIGQKNSNIVRTIAALEPPARSNTRLLSPRPPPTIRPTSISRPTPARPWRMVHGKCLDALIVYDDLSKHAVAYRQIRSY